MANHKSAKKRAKQTIKKTAVNKARRTSSKSIVKKIRIAIEEGNKALATELLPKAQSVLGKLAKVGVFKDNKAARVTSRLASQISKLQ